MRHPGGLLGRGRDRRSWSGGTAAFSGFLRFLTTFTSMRDGCRNGGRSMNVLSIIQSECSMAQMQNARVIAPKGPVRRRTALKTVTLLVLVAPAILLPLAFFLDLLGDKPMERLREETGSFAIRFLLLSLAISPARSLLRWSALIGIRRYIGLACFFYALTHFGLFALQQMLDPLSLLLEIFRYPYLIIGFTAL